MVCVQWARACGSDAVDEMRMLPMRARERGVRVCVRATDRQTDVRTCGLSETRREDDGTRYKAGIHPH